MDQKEGVNMGKKASIVLFSGDLDKTYAAFIIAAGAAAMGMDVTIFCTFWGLQLLKRGGLEKAKLSKMNMGGLGKKMILKRMKKGNVIPLKDMLKELKELDVKLIACDMTMGVMGVSEENLIPEVDEIGGVGTYINDAKDSEINLFI